MVGGCGQGSPAPEKDSRGARRRGAARGIVGRPPAERERITIPDLYPDLARLLADYFQGERAREPGARHQDAVLAFALTESHGTLLQTSSDARAILTGAGELAAFEQFLREMGYDFSGLGDGVTAGDWLADVVALLGTAV